MDTVIKRQLKKYHITLTQFSDDFNISRPTLNTYIDYYENNQELPSDVFQRIFDYLFNEESIDEAEFNERYRYVQDYYYRKYTNRGANDLLGYSRQSERNYNSLLMTIQKDMVEKNISDLKFMLINYILKNDEEQLDQYIDFYLSFYGAKKFNVSKYRDNKLIVLLYKAMQDKNQKMKKDDYKTLDEFITYSDRLFEANMQESIPQSKKVTRKLASFIEEKYGHLSDEELDVVIEELSKKLK